jgi:hypothetical protein
LLRGVGISSCVVVCLWWLAMVKMARRGRVFFSVEPARRLPLRA